MANFSGATLALTAVRDASTTSSYAGQTWKVHTPVPIRVESFVADIRIAGTYTFNIDGATVATVPGVAAATNGVTFTPSDPTELTSGVHTFKLSAGATILWYSRNATTNPTGTGGLFLGWDLWEEPGTAFVPGTLNYKLADGVLVSHVETTNISTGSFAAQTWTVTLDTPVEFYGLLKRLRDADATGYVLSVDGVNRATVTKAGTIEVVHGFTPAALVPLAAGSHTFKLQPSAVRRWSFTSGTTTAPSGDPHTTAWSVWAESTGNKVSARLFYRLPAAAPAVVTDASGLPLKVSSGGALWNVRTA